LRSAASLSALGDRTFGSLRRHRNYRLYFAGNGISFIGTWMQQIAAYWLVLQLTHSPIAVGALALVQTVPVTALALGNVEEHEMAAAAGLQNFLRTLSGAVATSVVQTVWENTGNEFHADLAGSVDRSGQTAAPLAASGMSADQQRQALDNLLTSQSVMLATNQIMFTVALICAAAAFLIWLAPRPARAVDMTKAGH